MVHEACRQPPGGMAHPAGGQRLGKQGPRGHGPQERPPPADPRQSPDPRRSPVPRLGPGRGRVGAQRAGRGWAAGPSRRAPARAPDRPRGGRRRQDRDPPGLPSTLEARGRVVLRGDRSRFECGGDRGHRTPPPGVRARSSCPRLITEVQGRPARSPRAAQIVATARFLLEREGPEALTMRRLGEELGIRAPSLYKHLTGKKAIELALIEAGFRDIGAALHAALGGRDNPVDATRNLLATYRRFSLAHPNLYRLATAGRLPPGDLTPGVEDWAGEPFLLVTGGPPLAQAPLSFCPRLGILGAHRRY